MTTTDDLVKKAKEEFNPNKDAGDSFESLRKDILEWLSRVGRPKNMGGYSNEFIATSIISDFYGEYVKLRNKYFKDVQPLVEEINRQAEEIERLKKEVIKWQVAQGHFQILTSKKDFSVWIDEWKRLEKENQELEADNNMYENIIQESNNKIERLEKENQEQKSLIASFNKLADDIKEYIKHYDVCEIASEFCPLCVNKLNSLRKSGNSLRDCSEASQKWDEKQVNNIVNLSDSQEGDKLYCSECGVMAEDCVCSLRESGEEDE